MIDRKLILGVGLAKLHARKGFIGQKFPQGRNFEIFKSFELPIFLDV